MSWVAHSVPDRDERAMFNAPAKEHPQDCMCHLCLPGRAAELRAAPVSSIWIKQPAQWFAEMRRVVDQSFGK